MRKKNINVKITNVVSPKKLDKFLKSKKGQQAIQNVIAAKQRHTPSPVEELRVLDQKKRLAELQFLEFLTETFPANSLVSINIRLSTQARKPVQGTVIWHDPSGFVRVRIVSTRNKYHDALEENARRPVLSVHYEDIITK